MNDLYILETLNTNWIKVYCDYQKQSKIFRMIPYNQASRVTASKPLNSVSYNQHALSWA